MEAPAEYANSQLNGSECVVVSAGGADAWGRPWDFGTVLLLSGPRSGREWQVRLDHLHAAPATPRGAAPLP